MVRNILSEVMERVFTGWKYVSGKGYYYYD